MIVAVLVALDRVHRSLQQPVMLVLPAAPSSAGGTLVEKEREWEHSSMSCGSLSVLRGMLVLFPPLVLTGRPSTSSSAALVSAAIAGCANKRGNNNGSSNTTTNFNEKRRDDTAILYVCFAKSITEFINLFWLKHKNYNN